MSPETSSTCADARNTATTAEVQRCVPSATSITAGVSVSNVADPLPSAHYGPHEQTSALTGDGLTAKMEDAWELRKEAIIARGKYDSYMAGYLQAESDAKRSANSTEADIKDLEARVLRQPGSQTPEQTKELQNLQNTLFIKIAKCKNIQKQKKLLSKDVKEVERRLLAALMETQPFTYVAMKQTAKPKQATSPIASKPSAGINNPTEMIPDGPGQSFRDSKPLSKEDTPSPLTYPPLNAKPGAIVKEAMSKLHRLENHYWEMKRELEDHLQSFDEQLKSLKEDDNGKTPVDDLEDVFGQVFIEEGREITLKLTRAEEDLKEARKEARMNGVHDPNTWDQTSGFISVEGEGKDEEKGWDTSKNWLQRSRIEEWMNKPAKRKILELDELEYATSGAEVEVWESTSSRGEPSKRRKIEACNASTKSKSKFTFPQVDIAPEVMAEISIYNA
ncbi:hypothetical protein N0V83_000880 [Neocucurbitaria cava]|uniref:Uncharacterized protein n=1 Tax=Neocucurbitaria cava TaxID=798079 RepID=A0A9W9CRI2_9PLEO|nr:hypothetical protein N0V83_000880 [Neocucurbitaria cava]